MPRNFLGLILSDFPLNKSYLIVLYFFKFSFSSASLTPYSLMGICLPFQQALPSISLIPPPLANFQMPQLLKVHAQPLSFLYLDFLLSNLIHFVTWSVISTLLCQKYFSMEILLPKVYICLSNHFSIILPERSPKLLKFNKSKPEVLTPKRPETSHASGNEELGDFPHRFWSRTGATSSRRITSGNVGLDKSYQPLSPRTAMKTGKNSSTYVWGLQRRNTAVNNYEDKMQEKNLTEMSLAMGTTFSPGRSSGSQRGGWEAEKLNKIFNKAMGQGDKNESLGPAEEGPSSIPQALGLIWDPN